MSLPTNRAQGDIIDPADINNIATVVNELSDSGTSGPSSLETYTGPTPLGLAPAPDGTVRQFYVAASGNIDGVAVEADEFHTFAMISTGWQHFPPMTSEPTPGGVYVEDTTPPTIPPSLNLVPYETSIHATWTESTDDLGVAAYEVSIDGGVSIITLLTSQLPGYLVYTTHTFEGLSSNTEYTVQVRAVDGGGNRSGWRSATTSTTGQIAYADTFAATDPTTGAELNGRTTTVGGGTWVAVPGTFSATSDPGKMTVVGGTGLVKGLLDTGQLLTNFTLTAQIMWPSDSSGRLVFRATDTSNGLETIVEQNLNKVWLGQRTGGTLSEIQANTSFPTASFTWYTVVVTVNGTICNVTFNGTAVITNATIPAATVEGDKVGIAGPAFTQGARFRNLTLEIS